MSLPAPNCSSLSTCSAMFFFSVPMALSAKQTEESFHNLSQNSLVASLISKCNSDHPYRSYPQAPLPLPTPPNPGNQPHPSLPSALHLPRLHSLPPLCLGHTASRILQSQLFNSGPSTFCPDVILSALSSLFLLHPSHYLSLPFFLSLLCIPMYKSLCVCSLVKLRD